MDETLEDIQRFYSSALANFEGDAAPFRSAEERIARLLETQYRENPAEEKKPQAAMIVGAVAAVFCSLGRATQHICCGNGRVSCTRCASNPASSWFPTRKTAERFTSRDSVTRWLKIPKNSSPKLASIQILPIYNWSRIYSLDNAIVAKRAAECCILPRP